MEKADIDKLLRPVCWDYMTEPYELFEVAVGAKEKAGSFNQKKALIRIFERLWWYDLLTLFGIAGLKRLLTREIISEIRIPQLREKYEFARKILHGEPVSFSGWSPEYREKIRYTLLSDRWYRTQPGVF